MKEQLIFLSHITHLSILYWSKMETKEITKTSNNIEMLRILMLLDVSAAPKRNYSVKSRKRERAKARPPVSAINW